MSKIAIIGSGFSGLSAAAYSAQKGHEVHVFEKTAVWEVEPENSLQITDILSIWVQAGIGCRILLRISLQTLIKKLQIFLN